MSSEPFLVASSPIHQEDLVKDLQSLWVELTLVSAARAETVLAYPSQLLALKDVSNRLCLEAQWNQHR